jgi:hypothetical protein
MFETWLWSLQPRFGLQSELVPILHEITCFHALDQTIILPLDTDSHYAAAVFSLGSVEAIYEQRGTQPMWLAVPADRVKHLPLTLPPHCRKVNIPPCHTRICTSVPAPWVAVASAISLNRQPRMRCVPYQHFLWPPFADEYNPFDIGKALTHISEYVGDIAFIYAGTRAQPI